METIKIGKSYAYMVPYLQSVKYDKKIPTVVICPGGAYFYTSQREAEPVAYEFLAKGYNVFVLHYSTMASKMMIEEGLDYESARNLVEDRIIESEEQPSQFPIPLVELALALKHIHEHAEEYHVDTDNIITCGFSAGANLVSLMGSYWHEDWLNELAQSKKENLKVKAQIVAYGYMDLISLAENDLSEYGKLEEALSYATFNNLDVSDADLKSVSASHLVNSNTPASFVWHTREDGLIPVEQSLNYCLALNEHSIPFELHIFDKGDHGLSVANKSSMSENKHAHNWVSLFDSWFNTYYKEDKNE